MTLSSSASETAEAENAAASAAAMSNSFGGITTTTTTTTTIVGTRTKKKNAALAAVLVASVVAAVAASALLRSDPPLFSETERRRVGGGYDGGESDERDHYASSESSSQRRRRSSLPNDDYDDGGGRRRKALGGQIPPHLRPIETHLADVTEPLDPTRDTAYFWHVHKAAGTAMATMMSHCMDLVLANEAGGYYGWDDHDQLAIFEVGEGADGARYVNVDTTSLDGLKRAHDLGLARSGMADVIVAARFVPAVRQLFDERYRGRMFALLRHPVERAVSMYYYRQYATWEPTYEPCLSEMTVLEYARNPRFVEGNWMVRTLTDKMVGEVTRDDLEAAKEILRRKCLVGIVDGSSEGGGRMAESVRRFDAYFGFSAGPGEKKVCTDNLLHDRGVHGEGRGSNKHSHPHYGPESPEWKALAKAHELDMELYQYAEGLFEVQGALLEEMDLST